MEDISIYCPYCHHKHENWQDYIDTGDMDGEFPVECEKCGKKFIVSFNTTIKFVSKKI